MYIPPGDLFLHAFDCSKPGNDAAVVASDSDRTTPFETPLCSPLIFPIDLPEFSENPQMPPQSFSESKSSSQDLELYLSSCSSIGNYGPSPHSSHSASATADLFYTPQGMGEYTPLDENAPLLLQPNSSTNILPESHRGTDLSKSKRSEFFQTTAHNIASMECESPVTPSVTTLALECGESALESSGFLHRTPIKVSFVDDHISVP